MAYLLEGWYGEAVGLPQIVSRWLRREWLMNDWVDGRIEDLIDEPDLECRGGEGWYEPLWWAK